MNPRMKTLRLSRHSLFAALTTALALASAGLTSARANLLIYEGFTGYTSGQLAGQNPNDYTVGLNKTVAYYDGNSPSRAGGFTLTTGLTFGSLQTSGGALAFNASTNVIGTSLNLGTSFSGTLWSSYLVNFSTQGNDAANGALIRIGGTPQDSTGSRFTSWADSRASSKNVAVGYASGGTGINGNAALVPGTTYIIISRFTNVGATLSSSSPGVATLWALTEAQFANFLAAGGDEAALTLTSVTATASHSVSSGTYSLSGALSLVTVNDTGVFDEIRFGSSLADVTPVPEPGSSALFAGLGGLLLCFFYRRGLRRRRRAA